MGGCSCSIEGHDGDSFWGAFFETVLVARKKHFCCECGRIIEVGEEHEKFTGYEDCDWDEIDYRKKSIFRTCNDCLSLRNTYFCSWIWGEIWNALSDEIHEVSGEMVDSNVLKLTPKARDKFFDLIEEYWADHFDGEEE